MNANVAMWLDQLFNEAGSMKVPEGCLDDIVHDAASEIATAVNNNGTRDQIKFILEQYGKEGIGIIRNAFKGE